MDGGGKPGFDHCFVVDDYKALAGGSVGVREALRLMAVLRDPQSGRAMDVLGTQPGVQVSSSDDSTTGSWGSTTGRASGSWARGMLQQSSQKRAQ